MKLAKRGRLVWLSHLDLVRVLDRAVRRAAWPLSYSEGFHPHARISFAAPLPVGMAGLAEPCVCDLDRRTSARELAASLSRQLPEGLELGELELAWRGRKSPLAGLLTAEYQAALAENCDLPALREAAAELLRRPEWRVERETKRQLTSSDIRPGLRRLEILAQPFPSVLLEVSLEPERLVKPGEVTQALGELAELPEVAVREWTRNWLR